MRRKRSSSSWQAGVLQNPTSAAFNGGWGFAVLQVVLHALESCLIKGACLILPACVAECLMRLLFCFRVRVSECVSVCVCV